MQFDVNQVKALHDKSEALFAIYNPDDCISYANPAFREAFWVGENEHPSWTDLVRRNYFLHRGSHIVTNDIEKWLASTLSRRAKLSHRSFESDLLDGRWLWITETTLANGWGLFVGVDITALRTDERDLRQARDAALKASQTDELTGISNRRHIMSLLEATLAGQTSTSSCMGSICILDIDHFKRLNDTYGHQIGDEVLIEVSRTIRAKIRVKDSFGRVGGEEFMLLFPDTGLEEAKLLISDVLAQLRECRPSRTCPQIRLTCSAGLTQIQPTDDLRSLYSRADNNLYEAKRSGRDRYVACGD